VGTRTPGTVVRLPPESVPLIPLVDVLRGGPGQVVIVTACDSTVVANFKWASGEILNADGVMLARTAPDGLAGRDGELLARWDDRNVWNPSEPSNVPAFETEVVRRDWRPRTPDTVEVRRWNGATVGKVTPREVQRADGVARYRFDEDIPMVLRVAIAANLVPGMRGRHG
jgi:hypothetical protein